MRLFNRTKIVLAINLQLVITSFSFAQSTDSLVTELDEIIIAENRIQLPYSQQSRSIALIDKKMISQTAAISVADVLHHIGGVDVRTRGANGVQADIGIRGGTFDQTLILINGVKISDPQTGHHSLNLPVDLSNIERIEVLKGPGARTFGQNAFSGAVNIITQTPSKSYLKIAAQGGDFGLFGARVSGAIITEKQSHNVSFNYDQSNGYKHNTDYTIFNGFYEGSIKLGSNKLSFMGGITDRAFGANGFYASPDFTEQYETIQTGLAALTFNTMLGKATLETRAYYRQNDDEYIFIRDNPEFFKNNHTNRTFGMEVNAVIPHKSSTTGIGIDVNKVTLRSNNLGERERIVTSMFIEHRMEFYNQKLNITPGIQLNYYTDFGFNSLPGIDVGYSLSNHITVFGNIGYTYRIPTYTDMYYQSPVNEGNPGLLPEYAWNYELGLKTKGMATVNAEVSLFYRDGKNMIDWVRATDTDPWKPINVLDLDMRGFDTNVSFKLDNSLPPTFKLLSINYTFIDAKVENPENQLSRYALENLQHQFRATLNLGYGNKIVHSISAGYYDRVNLDDYTVVDSRISYKEEKLSLFADVTNIFDVEYQETNLVVMPGRWFKMGVSFDVF
ncbi:MAG: TonB-dependent receptor [Cyclobacteriaceae bacterium]|nr:TonB-dependent receptor [Cyclobacteriaceae bacterium]